MFKLKPWRYNDLVMFPNLYPSLCWCFQTEHTLLETKNLSERHSDTQASADGHNGPECFPPGSYFLSTPWINVDYRSWALTQQHAALIAWLCALTRDCVSVFLGGWAKKWLQHFAESRCCNGHLNKYCTSLFVAHTPTHTCRNPLFATRPHSVSIECLEKM